MPFLETSVPNFIPLKNKKIASYAIQYNLHQGFNFQRIAQIKSKQQFYYKGMLQKEQVHELMLIDTFFAEVIGKLAQEVLLNKVKTLKEFLLLQNQSNLLNGITDANYDQYKFEKWLCQLCFPEEQLISHQQIKTKQTANNNRVYVIKEANAELAYFSIYESKKLVEMLINTMQLRIDFKKSTLVEGVLTLVLNLTN